MHDEAHRVTERFQPLFDAGMIDVKFFVPKPEECSLSDILGEAAEIQAVIADGKTRRVDSIDGDFPSTAFDAPF
jgi:hypothetical protein